MANEQNLKKNLSPSEARENGAKGGKKSGEARRNKKMLKDCLEILLESKMKMQTSKGEKRVTGAEAMSVRLFEKFMKTGDPRIFETIRDTVGQKPADKVILADVDKSIIDEVEAMVNGTK